MASRIFAVTRLPRTGRSPRSASPGGNGPGAPAGAAGAGRLDFVDALRGWACLWVVLYHILGGRHVAPGAEHWPLGLAVRVAEVGWLGVSLFLVLSGFCLYLPLVRRQAVDAVRLDLKVFARKRCRRILPPYYIALALFTIVGLYSRSHHSSVAYFVGYKDVVAHVLMVHNLRGSTFDSINPVFWTIALEFQLYILFPLLVWAAARRGLTILLALTLATALAWQGAIFLKYGLPQGFDPHRVALYNLLPGRAFEFVAGMAAAALVARPQPWQARAARWVLAVGLLPALAFMLFVGHFVPGSPTASGALFAALIVVLAPIPNARFESSRVLRALVWAGTISYSIYLIHMPLLQFLDEIKMGGDTPADAVLLGASLAKMGLAVVLGYAFFLIGERPFLSSSNTAKPLAPAKAGAD